MTARLERCRDVLETQWLDPEERTEPEPLVARDRPKQENVHGVDEAEDYTARRARAGRSGGRATAFMTTCALIAAYNEAARIKNVVSGVRMVVDHVLVVDDGSTDETAKTAAGVGAEVVRHLTNHGKGAAIRTGLAALAGRGFSHVLLLDGDMQHDPGDAAQLIAAARQGAGDFIIGERRFDRRTTPRSRYYTNTISSWVISTCFIGQSVADTQCGFRLIATDLLARVKLSGRGYEIETEMLIKLTRAGARIARVPVGLHYNGAPSKLRPLRDTTRTCFLAVRYRFFPERFR
jgi:glycosyltransferase involved in cell wall biosynthesis